MKISRMLLIICLFALASVCLADALVTTSSLAGDVTGGTSVRLVGLTFSFESAIAYLMVPATYFLTERVTVSSRWKPYFVLGLGVVASAIGFFIFHVDPITAQMYFFAALASGTNKGMAKHNILKS